MARVDVDELRDKVKVMYRAVAETPQGTFHFEMGRVLAERLGYPSAELDAAPPEAIESFAGVGYHLGLAAITAGERVVDLGSGSGMDAFLAAQHAGAGGEVVGVDMTDEQLTKARRLAERDSYTSVRFEKGYIEEAPVSDGSADVVISNGVINLCDDKTAVFREVARMLKPGGRMAISDIVTERQLTEAIVCDVNLWASCIGGAMQEDDYRRAIEHGRTRVAHRAGQSAVPLHLGLSAGSNRDLRSQERLGPGDEAPAKPLKDRAAGGTRRLLMGG